MSAAAGRVFALPAPSRKTDQIVHNTLIHLFHFYLSIHVLGFFCFAVVAVSGVASAKIKRNKIWNKRKDSGVSPASRYPLCEHQHITALIFYACSQSRLDRLLIIARGKHVPSLSTGLATLFKSRSGDKHVCTQDLWKWRRFRWAQDFSPAASRAWFVQQSVLSLLLQSKTRPTTPDFFFPFFLTYSSYTYEAPCFLRQLSHAAFCCPLGLAPYIIPSSVWLDG